MTLYGFSIFLETPLEQRKGRTRYIMISFLITLLSTLSACLDSAWLFKHVLRVESGIEFGGTLPEASHEWERYFSMGVTTAVMFVGDALLVSFRQNSS